jgi:hypothetical protein
MEREGGREGREREENRGREDGGATMRRGGWGWGDERKKKD